MNFILTLPHDSAVEFTADRITSDPSAISSAKADIARAITAAEQHLASINVDPIAAQAAYRAQWDELDDEARMTGLARCWIDAREAANRALTATWATPGNLGVGILIA